MKKLFTTAATFALMAGAAHAEGKLSVYHWFEYIPQELVDKFEAETGIDVTIDTYDSNESMLAALKAGKMGQYDVAVPADFMVKIMADEGMLDTFTPDEMPNHGNIAPQWMDVYFDPAGSRRSPTSGAARPSRSTAMSIRATSPRLRSSSTAAGTAGQDQPAGQPERGADPRLALSRHPAMHDGPRTAQGAERHAAEGETALGLLRVRHVEGRAGVGRCGGGDDL